MELLARYFCLVGFKLENPRVVDWSSTSSTLPSKQEKLILQRGIKFVHPIM